MSEENREYSYLTNTFKRGLAWLIIIVVLGIMLSLPFRMIGVYNDVSEKEDDVVMTDKSESRLSVLAEHLETDPKNIIVEKPFFSTTYNITFNSQQYKAQFDYTDEGIAVLTNFSQTNEKGSD